MAHRDGKKFRGGHTSLTDLAFRVARLAEGLPEVTGIAPGYIRSGKAVAGGRQRVKIGETRGGLLLTVRAACSVEELRIFASDIQEAKLALARGLRDLGIPISFNHWH